MNKRVCLIMTLSRIQLGAINCFKEQVEVAAKNRDLDQMLEDKLDLVEKTLDDVSESLVEVMKDSAVGYYAVSSAAFFMD